MDGDDAHAAAGIDRDPVPAAAAPGEVPVEPVDAGLPPVPALRDG